MGRRTRLFAGATLVMAACGCGGETGPTALEGSADTAPPQPSPPLAPRTADPPTVDVETGVESGSIESCTTTLWFLDEDGDGWGAGPPVERCTGSSSYTSRSGDCDDARSTVHPLAEERCNDLDDDCDGGIDEDAVDVREFGLDADRDGYGDPKATIEACRPPDGYVVSLTDCDDGDPDRHPGREENWTDGVDTNCDGVVESDADVDVLFDGQPTDALFFERPVRSEVALRVVTTHESNTGTLDVELDLQQPTDLVIQTYQATAVRITESTPGYVQSVHTTVNAGSTLRAPSTARTGELPYAPVAYDWRDSDAHRLDALLEKELGRRAHSFHGIYRADRIVIREGTLDDMSMWPSCGGYSGPGPKGGPPNVGPVVRACPAATSESSWCLVSGRTGAGPMLEVVGLDTGARCSLGVSAQSSSMRPTMAWVGYDIHTCGAYGILSATDITTGSTRYAYKWCQAVVEHDGSLTAFGTRGLKPYGLPDRFATYPNFLDAQCDGHTDAWDQRAPHASRFAYRDGILYGLWHSTSELGRFSVPDGTRLAPISLEGFDQWTHGLSLPVADTVMVLSAHISDPGIYTFSATTGARLGEVAGRFGGRRAEGMVCFSGP